MDRAMARVGWAVLVACLAAGASAAAGAEPVELFNGKDLAGWKCFVHESAKTMPEVWRVEDGLLITGGEPLGYLYTTAAYQDYRLIVEWRWAPGKTPGNSGVLLRIAGDAISFLPKCYEAQLQSGNAGDIYGFYGLPLEGPADRLKAITHEVLGSFRGVSRIKGAEKAPGEWNRYEITVRGGTITLLINGEKVNEATGCGVHSGAIGLQSEGGEIHFRKVSLTPLK